MRSTFASFNEEGAAWGVRDWIRRAIRIRNLRRASLRPRMRAAALLARRAAAPFNLRVADWKKWRIP